MAGLVETYGPVEAERITAACRQRLQPAVCALAEDYHRGVALRFQRLHDLGQPPDPELAVFVGRERSTPGVEDHYCLRTRIDLRLEIIDDRARQELQEPICILSVFVQQRLHDLKLTGCAALHHVSGERPRTSRKTDQRNLVVELGAYEAQGLHYVT